MDAQFHLFILLTGRWDRLHVSKRRQLNQNRSSLRDPEAISVSFSASQNIPCLLWNLNVHYRFHKSLPHVFVLSQMNPIYDLPNDFFKADFTIIPICA